MTDHSKSSAMNSLLSLVLSRQWRIQDLKEGGARSIARFARAQKKLATPPNVDHAPHLRVLKDSWLKKKAVLGLVTMRKRCLRSEF